MKLAAHRGNRAHAPENHRFALVSAWVAGADVLTLDVRLSKDGALVVAHDPTTERVTGEPGRWRDLNLADLLLKDVSTRFQPRGATNFIYYHGKKPLAVETLPELLDALPPAELWLELHADDDETTERRKALVAGVARALLDRGLETTSVVVAEDPALLEALRTEAPSLRRALQASERTADELVSLARGLAAEGLSVNLERVLSMGVLTPFGERLAAHHGAGAFPLGALLIPASGGLSAEDWRALAGHGLVRAAATASILDTSAFTRPGWSWLEESFAGTTFDARRFALGYAKANPFAKVFQQDGIHVEIAPYDGPLPPFPSTDETSRRVAELEVAMDFVERDWPYYSGGGLGVLEGIAGDFSAEVDTRVEVVAQATTFELAVTNVDPGAHQPTPPLNFRGKDSFYDPHGAPPFVGVEHDEDDGYRINWNLGSEYDSNQYGRPVGDGKTPRAARLRLDRRGPFFAAYYRNAVDAPDWVCVGTTRNDSMNSAVYLRCAGKRWRQEDERDPTKFLPVVPNHFVFRQLAIRRFRS